MPFIEVLTRCHRRPALLAQNQVSLANQTDPDLIHTLLVDEVGLGVGPSHLLLADYAGKLVGEWIWILDDDDVCTHPRLVEELKVIVACHQPDVVMAMMDHGPRGVLPQRTDDLKEGDIGISAYLVKRPLWQQCADAWRSARYASDYDFYRALMATKPRVHYWPLVISKVQ